MVKKLQALKAKKGFTLVELIVVIAIIAVLAAILVPTMLGYVTSSRVTSANSTASQIKDSINNWITDMDTKGYSTLKTAGASGAAQAQLDVKISSGTWTITTPPTAAVWGTGSAAELKDPTGATNKDVWGYLEEQMQNDYSFTNASFTAYFNEGKVHSVVYSASDTMPDDIPEYSAFTSGTFTWGSQDGILTTGEIVGTSPQLTTALS